MNQQPRFKKGDRIGGRYQVHQALMGGMGEVYLCLDLKQMVPYALKTFQQRYLEQASRLHRTFEQEVLVWVALEKHPNIVRCFYMDTLDNQPFMVLEWIAGEEGKGVDLRGWLRQGPLALQQALDFAIDICYGLAHAQQKQPGIVHRDLKPENILIAQGGLAKITDFGLAQMVVQADLKVAEWAAPESPAASHPQQSLAAQGGVAGTPPYMPPEQWQPGVSLDERADIYAVGCILHEMLTGHPPFAVDIQPTTPATYQRWLSAWQWQHEHAARPMIPDTIPAPLAELLSDCLAREREGRPQDSTRLLEMLQQVYTDIVGQPPRMAPALNDFSFTDYNNRGLTYHGLGRYEEALADYEQAICLNPADALVYSNRGNTYALLGRYEQALADYEQAICLNPSHAGVYTNRGFAYATLGQHEDALADYEQAIRLNPAHANAYNNRGRTYAALQQYEAALAEYRQAIRLNPANADAYIDRGDTYSNLGRYEEALADYREAIRLNPAKVNAYNNRASTYAALGWYEEAMAEYEQAIRLDPSHAGVYANRGFAYATLGQHEDALADYEQAIRLNPAYVSAYKNRGDTYYDLGRYEEALVDYGEAIRFNPADADAYINRGTTYAALGWYEEALADYEQTIRLSPTNASAYTNRGNTHQHLSRYKEALANYEQAIRLDPAHATAFYNRGVTYAALQQYQAALADYSRAIDLDSNNAPAYTNRGATYATLQQYQAALADYSRAINLDPNFAPAYTNRGVTYHALQQHEAALADFSRAIDLEPNDAQAYYNVGALLANQGQLREALPYLEKAAQLGHAQGAQYAAQVRQILGIESAPGAIDPAQQAFEAFQQACSLAAMRQAVASHPILIDAIFITAIEEVIDQQVTAEHRPALEQRLTWLRQIAQQSNH